MRPETKAEVKLWVGMAALFAVIFAAYSCGSAPKATVQPDLSATIRPIIEGVTGDIRQDIRNVQKTLTSIDQRQSTMGDVLGAVQGDLNQRVYGTSPEDVELQLESMSRLEMFIGVVVLVFVGLLFLALAAPAVMPLVMTPIGLGALGLAAAIIAWKVVF